MKHRYVFNYYPKCYHAMPNKTSIEDPQNTTIYGLNNTARQYLNNTSNNILSD